MTQGINEANKLYNEKLVFFNKELEIKNNKLLEYKNKILVLKRKINEMYEEMNLIRGNSSINNTSFFSTSFINNSIINTNNQNQNQKMYDKTLDNINAKENAINKYNNNTFQMRKKLSSELIGYNPQTIDRNNIKNNLKMNKTRKKINSNNAIISPHIKKEILFPQTPQIQKNILYNRINKINSNIELSKNKMKEFVDKNKDEENKNLNFIKEYKEILEKLTKTINSNIYINKK